MVQSPLSPESVGWSEGVMCKGESLEAAPAHIKSKLISRVIMLSLTNNKKVTFSNVYNQIVFKEDGIKSQKKKHHGCNKTLVTIGSFSSESRPREANAEKGRSRLAVVV